jgi:hypothetical protein
LRLIPGCPAEFTAHSNGDPVPGGVQRGSGHWSKSRVRRDVHRRDVHRIEPVCRVSPIGPPFYDSLTKWTDPRRLSDRAVCDEHLSPEIEQVFEGNPSASGMRNVWHQMHREGFVIARCAVVRRMRDLDLEGVIRARSVLVQPLSTSRAYERQTPAIAMCRAMRISIILGV